MGIQSRGNVPRTRSLQVLHPVHSEDAFGDCSRVVPSEGTQDRWLCSSHCELLDHRTPRKLLSLCHCCVAQLDLTWMCISSVHFVFSHVHDMEARLGLAGRCVVPVFQHSRRHCVGFIRDLVKTVSVGLLKRLLNTLVSFSLPRKLGLKGSLLMGVQATEFFESAIWTVARRGIYHRISGSTRGRSYLVCGFS